MNPVVVLLGEVTVIFAAALLGALLASRARAALRHLILASAFGVALILPLATLVSPTITVEIAALPAREPDAVAAPLVLPPVAASVEDVPLAVEANSSVKPLATVPASSIPVTTWFLLAWAVIALAALLPVIAGLWHIRGIRRRSQLWPTGAARALQLMRPDSRRALVLLNEHIAAPITGGLVQPAIALPADAVGWSDAHLANALLHELEHVRRHDWAVHLAARAVCALYWFHPLAWIAWKALRLEAERACDDAVLAREDAAVYAEQLLELARRLSGKPALPGLHMAGDSSLSSRIKAVLDNTRQRGRTGKIVLAGIAIAGIVIVGVLAPLRAIGPTRGTATQDQSQPATDFAMAAAEAGAITRGADVQNEVASREPIPDSRMIQKPDRTSPPTVDASTGGFTIRRLNSPVTVDGKLWIDVDRIWGGAIWGGKTYTAPDGQFSVALVDPNEEGDVVRSRVTFTEPGGKPINLIPDVAAYALVTPDLRWVFLEPLDVVDVKTWRRYRLADKFGISAYITLQAVSADGRRLFIKQQPCPFDCQDLPNEYYELGFPGLSTASVMAGEEEYSPRAVVATILDLVQSALEDESTGKLDEITRPITGLHHVQRHAQAVLDDDGSNPAGLAANYLEIVNALINTADLAANVAARPPEPGLSPPRLQQLASAMRAKSADLSSMIMPVSDVSPTASPAHRAAGNAFELAQRMLDDTRFARAWLHTELVTLRRAAQSVASDDGDPPGATLKLNLLRSSLRTTTRQADQIVGRSDAAADARRKAAELATSLRDIAGQLDVRATSPPAANVLAATTARYAGYQGRDPLPRKFDSRDKAKAAGCLFGNVKGPGTDNCVLGAYEGSALNLRVYDRQPGGTYSAAEAMSIPSQYHETGLSLVDMSDKQTDWLVIETTGMHGTGIAQRVLFVIGWDGRNFRTLVSESLDYRCENPSVPANYSLHVEHSFKSLRGAPGLLLDYELKKDGQLIGKWSDQLRWGAYQAVFVPYQATIARTDPAVNRVLAQIKYVRVYSASGPMNPTGNIGNWMGQSELMNVLAPVCSPSLLYLARSFSGKWMLDKQPTPAATSSAPPLGRAGAIGVDRQAVHFSYRISDSTAAEDIYPLNGKEASVSVRLTSGKTVQGKAVATLDGEKMVVTIAINGQREPLRRVFYLDGYNLVVEESGNPGMRTVTYYTKM